MSADDPESFADLNGHELMGMINSSRSIISVNGALEQVAMFGGPNLIDPLRADIHEMAITAEAEWAQRQVDRYSATVLGQTVAISITGGNAGERREVREQLDEAIAIINRTADQLTEEEKNTIHNVKAISADLSEGAAHYMDVKTGVWHIGSHDLWSAQEKESGAWNASLLSHEGFHVVQDKRGLPYTKSTAITREREANFYQAGVGMKFGLTSGQVWYLLNEEHTPY